MASVNSSGFKESIGFSKYHDKSLVGNSNEIIPYADWELDKFVNTGNVMMVHPHVEKMHSHILEHHKPKSDIAVVCNCSTKKPYSESKSFRILTKALGEHADKVDRIVISCVGVIPQDFESYYPFAHYAWDGSNSKASQEEFIAINSQRIESFFKKFPYKHIIGYFRCKSKGKFSLIKGCESIRKEILTLPSHHTFELIKDNMIKMNMFQTNNLVAQKEIHDVVGMLLNNEDPYPRTSPTPEEHRKLVRTRIDALKASGQWGKGAIEVTDTLKTEVKTYDTNSSESTD